MPARTPGQTQGRGRRTGRAAFESPVCRHAAAAGDRRRSAPASTGPSPRRFLVVATAASSGPAGSRRARPSASLLVGTAGRARRSRPVGPRVARAPPELNSVTPTPGRDPRRSPVSSVLTLVLPSSLGVPVGIEAAADQTGSPLRTLLRTPSASGRQQTTFTPSTLRRRPNRRCAGRGLRWVATEPGNSTPAPVIPLAIRGSAAHIAGTIAVELPSAVLPVAETRCPRLGTASRLPARRAQRRRDEPVDGGGRVDN